VTRLRRAEAAEWLRDRLAALPGTRWVGIDGLGAAGKTSFAAELAALLPDAHVIHIDDFARPSVRGWERARFVAEVLEPLLGGRPACYSRWDYLTDEPRGAAEVPPGVPVIVEGVSATDDRVPVPWDITVWLDVPEAIRRQRIEERDDEGLLYRWRTDWWPNEQAYVREQRPKDRPGMIVVVDQ
jgi:uridine kinase